MVIKRLNTTLEIKALSEKGEFEGYASVFNVVDDGGDIVVPGAFKDSLAEWEAKGATVPLLWYHDLDSPIGEHSEMREDDHGLFIKGRLWIDADPIPDAQAVKAYRGMKSKSVTGISIGYSATEFTRDGDNRILEKVKLWENSILPFPMNDAARITAVKAALDAGNIPDERTLEAILRDAGFSRKSAKAFIANGLKGLTPPRDADDAGVLESLSRLEEVFKL